MFSSSVSNYNLTTTLGDSYYYNSQFTDMNTEDQRSEMTLSKATQLVGEAVSTQIQVGLVDPETSFTLSLSATSGPSGAGTRCWFFLHLPPQAQDPVVINRPLFQT